MTQTQDQQEPYLARSQSMHRSATATEADRASPARGPAPHHHPTPPPGMGTQNLGTTMWQGNTSDTDTALPSLLAESKGVPGWYPCSPPLTQSLPPAQSPYLCPPPGRAVALAVLSVPWVLTQLLCCCHGCVRGASLPMTRPLQEGE